MAYGCKHNYSVVVNRYDLDGVCNVLNERVGSKPFEFDTRSFYLGALHSMNMLRHHEWRDQSEFFEKFDGIPPFGWEEDDGWQ